MKHITSHFLAARVGTAIELATSLLKLADKHEIKGSTLHILEDQVDELLVQMRKVRG